MTDKFLHDFFSGTPRRIISGAEVRAFNLRNICKRYRPKPLKPARIQFMGFDENRPVGWEEVWFPILNATFFTTIALVGEDRCRRQAQ